MLPGDAYFFLVTVITHHTGDIQSGERNAIDLFTHKVDLDNGNFRVLERHLGYLPKDKIQFLADKSVDRRLNRGDRRIRERDKQGDDSMSGVDNDVGNPRKQQQMTAFVPLRLRRPWRPVGREYERTKGRSS